MRTSFKAKVNEVQNGFQPGPSGVGRVQTQEFKSNSEVCSTLFKKNEYVPTPVFDELHKLGNELKNVYNRIEQADQFRDFALRNISKKRSQSFYSFQKTIPK